MNDSCGAVPSLLLVWGSASSDRIYPHAYTPFMEINEINKNNLKTGTAEGSVGKTSSPKAMPEGNGARSSQGSALSRPTGTPEIARVASTLEGCHLGKKKNKSGAEKRRRARNRAGSGGSSGVVERCGSGGVEAGSRKRAGPDTDTPPSAGARHPKRSRVSPGTRGAAPALRKVAIVKEGYPGADLLDGDIVTIQAEILRRVDDIPVGSPLPLLNNFGLTGGILTYYCEDESSAEWLKKSLRGFKINGIGIRAVDPSDLPKPVRVAFKTKDLSTKEAPKLLRRLGAYNSALRTKSWRVLQRTEDTHTQRWIFLVDRKSAEAIAAAQFRAHTGVDKGTFKFLDKPTPSGAETGGVNDGCVSGAANEEGESIVLPTLITTLPVGRWRLRLLKMWGKKGKRTCLTVGLVSLVTSTAPWRRNC